MGGCVTKAPDASELEEEKHNILEKAPSEIDYNAKCTTKTCVNYDALAIYHTNNGNRYYLGNNNGNIITGTDEQRTKPNFEWTRVNLSFKNELSNLYLRCINGIIDVRGRRPNIPLTNWNTIYGEFESVSPATEPIYLGFDSVNNTFVAVEGSNNKFVVKIKVKLHIKIKN